MDIMELALPQTNRFASDYMNGEDQILSFFDYDKKGFDARLRELTKRSFPREALSEVLFTFNRKFSPSEAVLDNIEKLKRPDSVVVIGGQQAGVLTGPLYTIHKCLSIIQLAKEQEKQLGTPVVPVFWIAGEDHDFDEINHTYILRNDHPQKTVIPGVVPEKKSASGIKLDQAKIKLWAEEVVSSFGETEYTEKLVRFLSESLECSTTFVDFFAHLIMYLFKDYGLVLVDSGDVHLRAVESSFFREMIRNNEELNRAVYGQIALLRELEFDAPIDLEPNSANLFYHLNEERVLLERDEEGNFRGKNNECLLSMDELLTEAEDHPERLSNNVVTRPLMQEQLFPTLAFIAGPGEIAYWGTLKEAFHLFDCRMPPLVPRLNITLVDRKTEVWLKDHGLSVEEALTDGVEKAKARWLAKQKQWDVTEVAERTKTEIDRIHKEIRDLALQVDPHLDTLGHKNIKFMFRQIDYFTNQIERAQRDPYERELAKFDHIEACLRPKQGLQERIWSVLPFLNRYGFELIDQLAGQPFDFNGKHKVVFL